MTAGSGAGVDAVLEVALGDLRLDAHLTAAPGEVVALLGPNGAGKTTALRALAGLVALDAGHVRVDGEVLDDPALGMFRPPEQRAVTVVFQDHLLFPHLSALDNVAFGLRARGIGRAEARREAAGWLDRFSLAAKAGDKPRRLSGGQAQRVALARALAPNPRLLLLDEPLAALDAGTRTTVRRDLRRYLDAFDGATILVTHDPLDALALATRVVILESGSVAQTGPILDMPPPPRPRSVAAPTGLTLPRGTPHGSEVRLDGGATTPHTADRADGPVYALIHPRAVAVHTSP